MYKKNINYLKDDYIIKEKQTLGTSALESRTHESDLQQFFLNAELANANFDAERSDFRLIKRFINFNFHYITHTITLHIRYIVLTLLLNNRKGALYHNSNLNMAIF